MGKRGPAPKPTAVKKIAGNPGKRKINKKEPKPAERNITAPDWMSPHAQQEWIRIYAELRACGLVSVADRGALTAYCVAWGRWVMAEEEIEKCKNDPARGFVVMGSKGGLIMNPLIRVADKAQENMLRAAKEFGMTPSSRTGLSIERNEDENEWAGLTTKH